MVYRRGKKSRAVRYTSVKGCMVIKPAGYALWENIQHELDRKFKETGVENVYMPMFIRNLFFRKRRIMWRDSRRRLPG